MFTVASIGDILVDVTYPRFYSFALFIVLFGVSGIFAAFFCYAAAMQTITGDDKRHNANVVVTIIIVFALLFIFLLAQLEGGEYKPAFISFGVTLGLTCWFVKKQDLDL